MLTAVPSSSVAILTPLKINAKTSLKSSTHSLNSSDPNA